MGLPNPSRETKFSGAKVDREILISPVQLATSRISNLTRLINTLAICVAIPYMTIVVSVEYNGGFLPDITLLALSYYH